MKLFYYQNYNFAKYILKKLQISSLSFYNKALGQLKFTFGFSLSLFPNALPYCA